jgi:glycosyltransferase involved in cell wall biosynthesis
MNIIHAMNAEYGRISKYSARSRYIVEESTDTHRFDIYARGIIKNYAVDSRHQFTKVHLPWLYQALRGIGKVSAKADVLKRAIWKGFDSALAHKILKGSSGPAEILHSWEWIPQTIAALRERNSNIRIVRDVVVNRYNEFFSGTPITDEDTMVDYFLSPSSFTTEKLVEWGISPEKIVEICFGVDTELFAPDNDTPPEPVRFAFSGGVSMRKGVDSLLRVWKRLDLPRAELHLYGRVRSDVKSELKGSRNVVCHGFVSLPRELPKNHVFVFPSTLEGSAKSVYEALACGLPVITTPDAGSIVRHEREGLRVETGNDDDLAQAIEQLYSDVALRKSYGANARTWAEQHTWHHYTGKILDFYEKIV